MVLYMYIAQLRLPPLFFLFSFAKAFPSFYLICIFLMINNGEHFFMYLLLICISYSMAGSFIWEECRIFWVLYILDISPLSKVELSIFSSTCVLSLHSVSSFDVKDFNLIYFHLLIIDVISCASGVLCRKS